MNICVEMMLQKKNSMFSGSCISGTPLIPTTTKLLLGLKVASLLKSEFFLYNILRRIFYTKLNLLGVPRLRGRIICVVSDSSSRRIFLFPLFFCFGIETFIAYFSFFLSLRERGDLYRL